MGVARTARLLRNLALAALVSGIAVATAARFETSSAGETDEPRPSTDILTEWQIPVTTGAAPGYVPDKTCALCHDDKARSFQDVAMAKSFYRPAAGKVIEDFSNNQYHHVPSDRYYEMELRGDDYWFRRYRIAPDGARIDIFEQKVDWILGSGNHSRVYLYQTGDGALFQLPLAWYAQDDKWAMAPGFERPDHQGVMRPVRRRCMFCHNAYPDVPLGSDAHAMPEVFPKDLPEGIGCQRCHGPGAKHVRLALGGEAKVETVQAAIVNPGKLPRDQLYDICYGCHLQPSVAVPAVRRFGRDAYDFRPGERLAEFVAQLDIEATGLPRADRFEINHHPYRLEQSTSFVESKGALGCLTCHDPHKKIPPSERAAHYRAACLTCHKTDSGGLPRMKATATTHPPLQANPDCTICHMPARRAQDVIKVVMTDHKIVRDPGDNDLTAPIEKKETEVTEIALADPHHGLSVSEQVIYKATAVLRHTSGGAGYAADALEKLLGEDITPQFEPWLELARSQIRRRKFDAALATLLEVELRKPGHPKIVEMRAVAKFSMGDKAAAISILERLLAGTNGLPEPRFNLAAMHQRAGNLQAAEDHARAAISDRHNLWPAWQLIGDIDMTRERPEDAARAYRAALAIKPDAERARQGLITALEKLGRTNEAARYRDGSGK